MQMRAWRGMAGAFFVALLAVLGLLVSQRQPRGGTARVATAAATTGGVTAFDVTLARAALDSAAALGLETPLTGRLFVVITRDTTEEPRLQTGVTGVPFWGVDVRGFGAGARASLGDGPDAYGYPLVRVSDLPEGDYIAQALLNVYTTFRRADGKVVEMHNETGEGQDLWRSPGNPISEPVPVQVRAGDSLRIALELTRVIPPIEPVPPGGALQQGNPQDSRLVRFVKLRSEKVSAFWGRDMWIGANVLLPRDYESRPAAERYPVIYLHGHFPGRGAPFGFTEDSSRTGPAAEFRRFWLSDSAPRMIAVTIRDANPYYDTSYSVNSANVGPWGDAIVDELIPFLERTFRIEASPAARLLAGGSTGGWEALASRSSIRTCSAARGAGARIRWTSAITRSSMSTRTLTRTLQIMGGCRSSGRAIAGRMATSATRCGRRTCTSTRPARAADPADSGPSGKRCSLRWPRMVTRSRSGTR